MSDLPKELPRPAELAALLSAKLCHDLISPTSAVVSGFDLAEDPDNASMKDEVMAMAASSARQLGAALQFCRVAYGASASATTFDARELQTFAQNWYASQKSELVWNIASPTLEKPAARAVMNLVQLGAGALARAGTVTITGDGATLTATAEGPRAKLRAEIIDGLEGRAMDDGMIGKWTQAYYLYLLVTDAGGSITHEVAEDRIAISVHLPT